jgi:hypothetical protein
MEIDGFLSHKEPPHQPWDIVRLTVKAVQFMGAVTILSLWVDNTLVLVAAFDGWVSYA